MADPNREQFDMLRSLFNEMYDEVNEQKKKKPDSMANAFKVKRINKILTPLYDLMREEPYAEFLELIPEPTEEKAGRGTVETGLSYSDIALVLSQYRSALSQFYQNYFYTPIDFGI